MVVFKSLCWCYSFNFRPCPSAGGGWGWGGTGACLAEETHGADLEAKPLVGSPKVIKHDVDDG